MFEFLLFDPAKSAERILMNNTQISSLLPFFCNAGIMHLRTCSGPGWVQGQCGTQGQSGPVLTKNPSFTLSRIIGDRPSLLPGLTWRILFDSLIIPIYADKVAKKCGRENISIFSCPYFQRVSKSGYQRWDSDY